MNAARQLVALSIAVAITLASSAGHAQEVQIRLGARRTAALALLGAAGAGIAAGIAFGVVSVVEHRRSRDLPHDNRTVEQQQQYQDAVDMRDDYRVASGVAAGVGLGLFLIGGALFMLDEIAPEPSEAQRGGALEIDIVPHAGRDYAGGALTVRF